MNYYEAWHNDYCVYIGTSKKSMDYEVSLYLETRDIEASEIDYYVNGAKQR